MAKLVGLIGTGRGKLGNAVLYKGSKGETLARVYQPQVSNPRTRGQVEQRSKINLIGQISALCSAALLRPFGGTRRFNRSEFNRLLIKAASTTTIEGGIVAKINPADVKFSHGAGILKASAAQSTLTAASFSIPLRLYSEGDINRYGERIICVVYANEDTQAVSQVAFTDAVLTSANAQNVDVVFGAPLDSGNVVAVYRVPFNLEDSSLITTYGNIYGTVTEIAAAIIENQNAQVAWGKTFFVDAVNFTQA